MSNKQFIKLEEGCFYNFFVSASVDLPDGEANFTIIDPNGIKHLLKKEFYEQYNIRVGDVINCRIDHINCTGKIFIEPKHPFYEIDKTYTFTISRFDKAKSAGGIEEEVAVVVDKLRKEVILPVSDLPSGCEAGDEFQAKVIRIKKGRIYISTDELIDIFPEIQHEELHAFEITDLKVYGDKYDYFILRDRSGRIYKLRKKYYSEYGFRIGQQIECRMIREENGFYFEPLHPYYKIGESYPFRLVGDQIISHYPDRKTEVYVFAEPYAKDILIPKKLLSKEMINGGEIKFTVRDIRHGEVIPDLTK